MVMSKALFIGYLRTTFWNNFGGEIALAIEDGTGVVIMDLLHWYDEHSYTHVYSACLAILTMWSPCGVELFTSLYGINLDRLQCYIAELIKFF